MKIAIYSDNFYPEVSGITTSIITTGKNLAKLGHNINYFVPRYSKKNYKSVNRLFEEIDLGEKIKITRLPSVSYPTGTKQGRFAIPIHPFSKNMLKKFNPDVIHSHSIANLGLEALYCAKTLKKPLVATDHTPMIEFLKYFPIRGKIVKKLVSKYDAWYYDKCDFVSSPCNAIFEELKRFGFKKPKHKAVSNPIEVDKYKPIKNKWPLKKKFGVFDYSVLFVGRIAHEKKIDTAIKAIANLGKDAPKLGLVIAGTGSQLEELKHLVKRLNLEKRVKFLGYFKKTSDLVDLYNASDLFVMPSVAETQSIVMLQAMACKLPVIAARAWGLKEYINEKNGILFEPGKSDELASKILYLYRHQEVGLKIGEEGRVFAEQFSPQNIAKEWEEIYLNTISNFSSK